MVARAPPAACGSQPPDVRESRRRPYAGGAGTQVASGEGQRGRMMESLLRAADDQREAELEPDILLPSQLGDGLFGAARLQPEKRLQLAVLEDAILTFERSVGVDRPRPRRLLAEVDAWSHRTPPTRPSPSSPSATRSTSTPTTSAAACDAVERAWRPLRSESRPFVATGTGRATRWCSTSRRGGASPDLARIAALKGPEGMW